MVCWLSLDQWCVSSRVRVTRAPSLEFLIFCFHNLHRRAAFSVKIPCSLLCSWMEEFPTLWALVEHLLAKFSVCLTNSVSNRAVIIWIWLFYREFCEGCESKKLKIAVGARVCAREKPLSLLPRYAKNTIFFSPWFSRAFFGELSVRIVVWWKAPISWDFSLHHLVRAGKIVRRMLKKLRRFWKNLPRFLENLPRFFRDVGDFLL